VKYGTIKQAVDQ